MSAAEPAPAPGPTAAELLAQAQAAVKAGQFRESRALLERLIAEFDDTPEAVAGVRLLLTRVRAIWKGGVHPPRELPEALGRIEASRPYQGPEAAELRATVGSLRAEIAEWERPWQDLERGKAGDPASFQRCGEAYLALHSRLAAGDGRAPDALFMAAQCLEAAGLWDEAAREYARLLELYPDGAHFRWTLENLVHGHRAVGRFEDAARYAERFVALYPKDHRVAEFLQLLYGVSLGQRDRALAVLDRIEALHARKDSERAAAIFWARSEHLSGDDERLQHAEAYLKRYRNRGGEDRAIVAEVTAARIRWQQACGRDRPEFDACAARHGRSVYAPAGAHRVRVEPRREGEPPTCGLPSTAEIEVTPRVSAAADEAQRRLMGILRWAPTRRVRIPVDDPERIRRFHDALAMAAVTVADRKFEELLVALSALAGVPAVDPDRRLAELLASVEGLASDLERQYAEVVAQGRSAVWSIAAAARLGQIAEFRADALLLREIPRRFAGKSQAPAYCAALREQAAPLLAAAEAGYERCLELSRAAGVFTEYSELCERALHLRDPARFARLDEIVGGPAPPESRPDVAGLQREPPPEPAAGSAAP